MCQNQFILEERSETGSKRTQHERGYVTYFNCQIQLSRTADKVQSLHFLFLLGKCPVVPPVFKCSTAGYDQVTFSFHRGSIVVQKNILLPSAQHPNPDCPLYSVTSHNRLMSFAVGWLTAFIFLCSLHLVLKIILPCSGFG